jgi:phosphatidate cytidylyltransferase
LLGAVLLGWMPAYLGRIRDLRPDGERLTLMLFVAIWAMDTAAYAVGKTWGRRALAPVLSPKKTREGFAAGLVAALATVFIFRALKPESLSLQHAIAAGLAIAVFGQLSDLAESMIKRSVGAKDSGAVLPGHGGVMDRFDSFLLSAPAVYYCLLF